MPAARDALAELYVVWSDSATRMATQLPLAQRLNEKLTDVNHHAEAYQAGYFTRGYQIHEAHEYLAESKRAALSTLWWAETDMTLLAGEAAKTIGPWIAKDIAPADHGILAFQDSPWLQSWPEVPDYLHGQRPFGYLNPPAFLMDGLWWSIMGKTLRVRTLSRLADYDLNGYGQNALRSLLIQSPLKSITSNETPACRPYDSRRADELEPLDPFDILASVWLLATSPGVVDETTLSEVEVAGQAHKPEHKRKHRPPDRDVILLTLRRPKADPHPHTGKREIEHDHRWIVGAETGGFWRNQVHGKDRALRRKTWINAYVAGPADKPLKIPEKVHVLRK